MPRSILRISIWKFNVSKPHVHTNGKPGFFLFFTQVMGNFVFSGYKKKKKPGFPFVGLCIINIVSKKSHPNTLHWAGHGQSTYLAVTWLTQLVYITVIFHSSTVVVGSFALSDILRDNSNTAVAVALLTRGSNSSPPGINVSSFLLRIGFSIPTARRFSSIYTRVFHDKKAHDG